MALLDALDSLDMKAVLDCHNYGHYKEAGTTDRQRDHRATPRNASHLALRRRIRPQIPMPPTLPPSMPPE